MTPTGSQYFWSHTPCEKSCGITRGKGRGSVPHHSATACCVIVASASVLSSHRCSSERASTRRTPTSSVSTPNSVPTATAPSSASGAGQPSHWISQAPATAPSMTMCPVVTLSTREVAYIKL